MKPIALILLAAIALIAAGCGNSEQNDYVKQVNAADAKAQAALSALSAQNTATPKQTAKAFDAAATKLEPVVADYVLIDPPKNAKSAHAKTVAGINGLVALLKKTADDFRAANTPAKLKALQRRMANITSAKPLRLLAQARDELTKAGYKVQATGTGPVPAG
jgi:PBP1b-binding outer membrane lipoprotein LpoB